MGERFAEYLRFKGMSQKKVSELSCVSESTLSRFCAGGTIASDKLLRILQVCDDLSLEWFFYATGNMLRSRSGDIVNNYGIYAGADIVSKRSVNVRGSRDVRVGDSDRHYQGLLMEKDRIILEKDGVIAKLNDTIQKLLDTVRP